MRMPRTGLLSRKENVRDAKLFIIATEGTLTEKQYFEGLFASTRIKIIVLDAGETGETAPNWVLNRLSEFEQTYNLVEGDERWLVADVDRYQPRLLRQVCQEAAQKRFQLAVSNPCFELWLLLHIADADPADTNCNLLEERLRQELGSYNKAKLNLSHYTKERIEQAIQRAELLDTDATQRWPTFPGTHLHKLVKVLLPHLRSKSR